MKNYIVKKINGKYAKEMIVANHYSHSWTSCKHAIGLEKDKTIVGVAVYGNPIGRHASISISPLIKENEVLELTRLWVSDSEGKNTESWFLGQTFRWLKKNDKDIKVLISYSDPNVGHVGTIYQATNWIYQGRNSDDRWYLINNELLHPRTVYSRFGTRAINELKKMDDVKSIEIIEVERKYRYLYILTGKRERRKIIKSLYRNPMPYDKKQYESENESIYEKESNWIL